MPQIDLSILNQRQTPAFYADVLANRPAAGFIGRIFVSTNTYEFYRDNGTSWDIIGGPGSGTVTGGGSLYRVAIWNSTSSIGESNNLIFDYSTNRLGIGTNTPGASLDVHSAASSIAQFNQTTATNNSLLVLQNSGSALWRIGNYYNAGANDFGVFDVIGAQQPLTIKKTTGQVLIGTSTVGSGKLVVSSATSDNGIQIAGANAPSLRIDNAESGPTKRAGLGISTAVNNFIQGSADRDFCIFNGSTTAASPMLFGIYDAGLTNVQEAARISAARNFLIGTTTDAGQKLQVNGSARVQGALTVSAATGNIINFTDSINNTGRLFVRVGNISGIGADGNLTFESNAIERGRFSVGGNFIVGGTTDSGFKADIVGTLRVQDAVTLRAVSNVANILTDSNANAINIIANPTVADSQTRIEVVGSSVSGGSRITYRGNLQTFTNSFAATEYMRIATTGNLLINTTTDDGNKLQVNGYVETLGSSSGFKYRDRQNGTVYILYGNDNGFTYFFNGSSNIASINMSTGVYVPLSDKNKKKNFEASNLGLDAVLKLKPTLYNMKSQSNDEPKELGFIAQEVKEVISQAYVENKDFIGLNYNAIVAALVKAVQELNTKIENLK